MEVLWIGIVTVPLWRAGTMDNDHWELPKLVYWASSCRFSFPGIMSSKVMSDSLATAGVKRGRTGYVGFERVAAAETAMNKGPASGRTKNFPNVVFWVKQRLRMAFLP